MSEIETLAWVAAAAWIIMLACMILLGKRRSTAIRSQDYCQYGHHKQPGGDCVFCDAEQAAALVRYHQKHNLRGPDEVYDQEQAERDALANEYFQATANRKAQLLDQIDAELLGRWTSLHYQEAVPRPCDSLLPHGRHLYDRNTVLHRCDGNPSQPRMDIAP